LKYAKCVETLRPDEIREMIKITSQPGVINFAGGLPAAELFPAKEMILANQAALEKFGSIAMQYHSTEGYVPLREKIVARLERMGIKVPLDEVLITSGSQQGIDLGGKLFVNEGDVVLTESPTYSGFFNAVKTYLPKFIAVPTDDDGIVPEALEETLKKYGPRVKLMYVIPDYQNPSGRAWSLERRKSFLEIIGRYEVPVLEDSPYRELCFEGNPLPTLKSLDTSGMIIHLGSFSKVFAPGYRIAYIVAQKPVIDRLTWASQGAFLQSSTVNQVAIDEYLSMYDLDAHIEEIRRVYKSRGELMISMMERDFPANVKFTRPKGGMFVWVELPGDKLARELLNICLKEKVAFVVGNAFYPDADVFNTFRMNFASMTTEKIAEGMERMAKAVRAFVA
jgi:2-aminoadipate transaminase